MEKLVGFALVAVILYGAFSFGRTPAPSLKGEVAIPRAGTDTHLWRTDGAEDRIRLRDRAAGHDLGYFDVDERGVLHQTPHQAGAGAVITDYRHQRYLGRPWVDVGAWAGVVGTDSGDPPVQLGLRVSPARFLDGVLAPDIVISEHAVGAGASLYLPRELGANPPWNRLGAGVWYMAAFNGDGSGPALGLTLTTR